MFERQVCAKEFFILLLEKTMLLFVVVLITLMGVACYLSGYLSKQVQPVVPATVATPLIQSTPHLPTDTSLPAFIGKTEMHSAEFQLVPDAVSSFGALQWAVDWPEQYTLNFTFRFQKLGTSTTPSAGSFWFGVQDVTPYNGQETTVEGKGGLSFVFDTSGTLTAKLGDTVLHASSFPLRKDRWYLCVLRKKGFSYDLVVNMQTVLSLDAPSLVAGRHYLHMAAVNPSTGSNRFAVSNIVLTRA